MKDHKSKFIIVILLLCLVGCGTGRKDFDFSEMPDDSSSDKIQAEAYLFDAKVKRQGKPTSFRLQIYETDSTTALSGKGYLGKGVMQGLIKVDSLLVYFPASDEYLTETVGSLISSSDCPGSSPFVNVMTLFSTVPDSLENIKNVEITANYSNPRRPRFLVFPLECPWQIVLEYDRQKTGWRLNYFEFDDGKDNIIKADRRMYKAKAKVPLKRFQVSVPQSATRIIP